MLKKNLFVDVIREVLEKERKGKEKQKKREILSPEEASHIIENVDMGYDNFLTHIAGVNFRLEAIMRKIKEGTEPYNDIAEVYDKLKNFYEVVQKNRKSVVQMLENAFRKLTEASSTKHK